MYLIREDGSEFKITNKKFDRCIVKLFDKEDDIVDLEFDKHKKNYKSITHKIIFIK